MSDFNINFARPNDIYNEPDWSSKCLSSEYSLDIMKDGILIDRISLSGKSYFIIGRQKDCDLVFEHPSLSRYHSVLQFCGLENTDKERGWYLYDLGSTHGSFINSNRIPPKSYEHVKPGAVLKFAGSTRLYLYSYNNKNDDDNACNWGIRDMDYYLEDNSDEQIVKSDAERFKNESKYKDDPKKVLKWYYEQEGMLDGPQFEIIPEGTHKKICKLELPIYSKNGEPIFVEVNGNEKNKEMIVRCSYEACKLLDSMDELYKEGRSANIIRKDNKYYEDKDYYSSDEDDYFDRTGRLEEKRRQRMKRFGVVVDDSSDDIQHNKTTVKDSNDPIVKYKRLEEINDEILDHENTLEEARREYECQQGDATELDELERYMTAIQSGTLTAQDRMKLRAKIFELQKEENLLRKQLKLQIPVTREMRIALYQCKNKTIQQSNSQNPDAIIHKLSAIKVPSLKSMRKVPTKRVFSGPLLIDSDEEEEYDRADNNPKAEPTHKQIASVDKPEIVNEATNSDPKKLKYDLSSRDREDIEVEACDADDSCKEINWVPPPDQSGDGRTHLNDELGY